MNIDIAPFVYEFPGSAHSLILRKTLSLKPHGCYLIAGPSGVGKSTFLKILKGFYPEFLEGKLQPVIESFENSFYLFQNPYTQLIQSSPFMEFLFSMENREFPNDIISRQLTLLRDLNLTEVVQRKNTRSLSHGECQKLLLASLISAKPDWIFLDEPTAFIDPLMRKEIYNIILEEKKKRGFLIIDHHYDEIKEVCDGIFELRFLEESRDVEIFFHTQRDEFERKITRHEKILELCTFDLEYKAGQRKIIFKNVSSYHEEGKKLFCPLNLEIDNASVATFTGRSGIGKSTLLKSILGVHRGFEGTIQLIVDGKEIPAKKRHEHLGFLFQNPENHFFFDTVEDEIKMTGAKEEDCQKLLDLFNLNHCLRSNPFFLSEGQKRRLSFLLVVLQKKSVLVLDEPTFGQDEDQIDAIKECIKISKKMGAIVLMVSHDPQFYQEVSDHVIGMKEMTE